MSMLIELYKYIRYVILPVSGSCDLTIVRKYPTPSGFNGEIYINGKGFGLSCDNLNSGVEVNRYPIVISFASGRRILKSDAYVIRDGEFTELLPAFEASVGSLNPKENKLILPQLIDALSGYKLIKLTVLNRLLVER